MESSLHRRLKRRYGEERGGRCEVVVDGFRVDALGPDGELIEVQSGALGPLRAKLGRLLDAGHRVAVVKPVVTARRIVRRSRADGPDLSSRLSPKRGAALDLFDDLVGLVRIFPRSGLRIEVLEASIAEVRVPRRRRPGYRVADRALVAAADPIPLAFAADLWQLIPAGLAERFTTLDLAEASGRSVAFAQRAAYCLRMTGAAEVAGKRGNRLIYARPADAAGPLPLRGAAGSLSRPATDRLPSGA